MSTDNFEKKVESIANKVEEAANKAWKKQSCRILFKSLSAMMGIGVIIVALHLLKKGYKLVAIGLFCFGAISLIFDLIINRK